ncbi:MAG: hypothetical protein CMJ58_04910 [Planctomycetaceae bacterium]|nr:hypothetical protein [Planctomycetaceae bacterium]
MESLLTTADDILRRAAWTTRAARVGPAVWRLGACLAAFALWYGAVMGAFRGLTGQEQWLRQMIYSAVKVPLLLCGAFVVGLPSFFVLSSIAGLRRDFGESVRALVAAQAGLAIMLAALSPLTIVWYASSTRYDQALAFNGVMFAAASLGAQYLLRQYYRPLISRNPRHRKLLVAWAGIYVLVAVQLAWLLRPFVGSPQQEVQFLRPEAWDNAYVKVAGIAWRALLGSP